MTVKEASKKFGKTERQIRKIINQDKLIDTYKNGRNIVIPDDIEIIISKSEVQSFLLQIVKYKNNKHTVISRQLCPTLSQLQILTKFLYQRGFIGEYGAYSNESNFFEKVQLTDYGLNYILGTNKATKLSEPIALAIIPNVSVNIGLVNVG